MSPFCIRVGRQLMLLVIACLTAALVPAHANDHAAAPAGGESIKLTVNLASSAGESRYLQFDLALEASPEASLAITANRPKVMHQLILLLSDERAERLITLKGKQDLAEKIAETINHVIEESPKTGVHEALFTNFIIQ